MTSEQRQWRFKLNSYFFFNFDNKSARFNFFWISSQLKLMTLNSGNDVILASLITLKLILITLIGMSTTRAASSDNNSWIVGSQLKKRNLTLSPFDWFFFFLLLSRSYIIRWLFPCFHFLCVFFVWLSGNSVFFSWVLFSLCYIIIN